MTGVFFVQMALETPAKVNLLLKVGPRREDGYHELATLFWPVRELCDTVDVELRASGGVTLSCSGKADGVPCDGRNLCCKAAGAFFAATGKSVPLHIHLTKRIPVTGGMGGGSSDAAAVLLELRRLLCPEMATGDLRRLAVGLGADVPFFLEPVPSLARGIGEELTPVPYRGAPRLFLVHPLFPSPASWAYAHFGERSTVPDGHLERMLAALAEGDWEDVASCVCNDLEACLFGKFPLLEVIRGRMEDLGVEHVHVSGSGPVLFGFETERTSPDARRILAGEFPGVLECVQ